MRRGITLIELLLSLAIVVVVTGAATRAFVAGMDYNQKIKVTRSEILARHSFEDTIRQLLRHAWLTSNGTDSASYFIGGTPSLTAGAPGLNQNGSPASSSPTGGAGGPDTVTFTVSGMRLPSSILASKNDFETNNQSIGPVGGISEVSLSLQPIGSQGQGQTGLFYRSQTPADSDPTQGGTEQLLSAAVTQISFQFFDGNQWQTTWDSRSQPTPRLPAAVEVSYQLRGESQNRVFVVRLPASDATSQNPVTVTG